MRIASATIAGSVVLFLMGYLIWGILLGSWFSANEIEYAGLSRQSPDLLMLYGSNLVFALLLAFVFDRWANIRTFAAGLGGGAVLGMLIHLGFELSILGYMNLYKSMGPVLADVAAEAARTSLGWGRGIGAGVAAE